MKDSTFLAIALLTSIVGIAAIAILSSLEAERADENVYTASVDEKLTLTGVVHKVTPSGYGVRYVAEVPIEVITFGDNKTAIHVGDHIAITGTVDEYQGKKSIVASQIKNTH
jgi:hypothetical protein